MHEALLLRMSDKEWLAYRAPLAGSGETGDSVVDEWEAELARGGIDALREQLQIEGEK
jgi:hypothetical protein